MLMKQSDNHNPNTPTHSTYKRTPRLLSRQTWPYSNLPKNVPQTYNRPAVHDPQNTAQPLTNRTDWPKTFDQPLIWPPFLPPPPPRLLSLPSHPPMNECVHVRRNVRMHRRHMC